jgi:L-rhamnose mutarotase
MAQPKTLTFNDGTIISLARVTHITPTGGDSNWSRYSIFLDSGSTIEVYENRNDRRAMPREEFIQAWNNFLEDN